MKMGFGIDCPKCGMIAFMLGCEHILFSDVLSCEMQCKKCKNNNKSWYFSCNDFARAKFVHPP